MRQALISASRLSRLTLPQSSLLLTPAEAKVAMPL
jgi:hypothetical protein